MKKILLTMSALFMLSANCAFAQVTIGELKDPESFSILELVSNSKGLRLPQLTTAQRDALHLENLIDTEKTKALGLQIFNTFTRCVETWNGVEWIQQCDGEPLDPQTTDVCTSCEVSTVDNLTFTAIADPSAVGYEFFIGTASQGYQISNSITFTASPTGTVGVKYYYRSEFLKPTMVPVTGSSDWKYGESNTATTAVITDFTMSKTPITQAQYEYVMEINPSLFKCSTFSAVYAPSSNKPVERVIWYDAVIFCNKLSKLENKKPCYSIGGAGASYTADQLAALTYNSEEIPTSSSHKNYTYWNTNFTCDFTADGYRLPTSSEWEYAARGGSVSTEDYTYSGSNTIGAVAWYSGNNGTVGTAAYGTKHVGGKLANDLYLLDMSGNVWEWCWGWYNESSNTYPLATPTGDAVVSTGSDYRVLRGGSWINDAYLCSVSSHNSDYPYFQNGNYGFRVVCR
ncbi:MAG: formylglycine-generating enzyme family protein [Dysgonamonadaceae bacterium]|jgi:formylglycine-generating enzyme required for sulfatase activity|nr:formylglycine-generating enzyme family protein [Dysgonamonadaceae bacterium]